MRVFSDMYQLALRNIRRNFRLPQLLVFSSIQPVMFLLLFNYVFGGAVGASAGQKYINFLLPGILAQTALFGAIQTGVGLAEDISRGVVDRLRSLPIARSAVLTGRTIADTVRNVFVLALMSFVGVLLGFRYNQGAARFGLALLLVLLFGFAFSWISATIGLALRDTETVQVAGFLWVFPLVFASSVFVPINTMPHWLQVFARNQPISQSVNAVRYLTQGNVVNGSEAVWITILWSLGILLVFSPIAVRLYRRVQ